MQSGKREQSVVTLAAAAASLGAAALWLYKQRHQREGHNPALNTAIPIKLQSTPYVAELELAVRLALEAGSNMFPYYDNKGTCKEKQHDLKIVTKGQPVDFCTEIDIENERLIMEGISKVFPSHKVIGEETTGTGQIPPLTKDPTWIIDPIDGTTNFASGLNLTCVSIAFCIDQCPVVGVVYSASTQELYIGVKGHGSYRNGVLLTKKQSTVIPMSKAIVTFEFGYARATEEIAKQISVLQKIANHGVLATRQLGSGVLDICYVATGKISVVYAGVAGEGWKPWDYAASMVIAKEAGCAIEAIKQPTGEKEFDIYSDSVICAVSQDLLEECRSVILS